MAVLVQYAEDSAKRNAVELIHEIFKTVEAMNPTKDAVNYWLTLNRTFLDFDGKISNIWREEKLASNEAIMISKAEALNFLAEERRRIMRLSRDEAIREVLRLKRLDKKIQAVQSVSENRILNLE